MDYNVGDRISVFGRDRTITHLKKSLCGLTCVLYRGDDGEVGKTCPSLVRPPEDSPPPFDYEMDGG